MRFNHNKTFCTVFIIMLQLCMLMNVNLSNAQAKKFRVFNAMMYKNMPSKLPGLSIINVIYDDSLLQRDINHPYVAKYRTINGNKILKQANKARLNQTIPVCLDVESWPLDDSNVLESKQKYISVLTQFKKANPGSKVGYYNLMPYADTYLYESDRVTIGKQGWKNKWINVNDKLKDLAHLSDISYPSFYTRTTNKQLWLSVVKAQVAKIKQIRKDIPVYAFVWPQYYNEHDASINYKFIDADTWMFELETLYKYCDGIVIWGSPFDQNRSPLYWDASAPWWNATQQFIKKYNIK